VSVSILFYSALVAAASGAAARPVDPSASAASPVILAQVIIQRTTTIVRVPPALTSATVTPPTRWKEKGGPDCIKWSTIAAAMISSASSLDVILRGGQRYRVKLGKSCQAIDFYSDFYVKATPDGQVCKSRDSIYSRAGGECRIDKFKTLARAK
jgi:hypothetical protein